MTRPAQYTQYSLASGLRVRISAVVVVLGAAAVYATTRPVVAQQGVNGAGRSGPPSEDARPFNPRDLSGVWRGQSYAYAEQVPAFTPEGQQRFEANKPGYGIPADSPQAKTRTDVHPGRRRAVPPGVGNDPVGGCNPLGLMRLNLYSPSPFEIIMLPNRMLQRFEWWWDHREVWTDGRPLPAPEEYLPRWNGYSVGRWDGDTFVIDTVGFDDRQWVDHFGYPISRQARLEERWRRLNYSNLELQMTLTDPAIYTTPWVADVARYRLIEGALSPVWNALVEDRCVPYDNSTYYQEAVRPAAGITAK